MSVSTALKQATDKIGAMISGTQSDPEILDTLKQEHEEVADLLKKLVESDKRGDRKALLAKIKSALLPHLAAEQTVLYDALIATKDKKIRQDAQEGYIEHELAATILGRLEKSSDTVSTEFSAAAKVLKELVEHHVEEEEKNIWADAKKQFTADERKLMNAKYLAAKSVPAVEKAKAPRKAAASVAAVQAPAKTRTAQKSAPLPTG